MALLFLDGFDHYLFADINKKWTSGSGASGINATGGRRGGGGLQLQMNFAVASLVNPSGLTAIMGFAYKPPSLSASRLAYFGDNGSTDQISLCQSATGQMQVKRGNFISGTVLGTSTAALTGTTAFDYVEWKVKFSTTIGTVDVYLNGVNVLSLTGQNTQAGLANWASFGLGGGNNIGTGIFDDLYVMDGSGSINNDVQGDVRVDAHYPNAAGTNNSSTPSTGTDRSLTIDEATPNTTDYNTLAAAGDKDTVNIQNLIPTGYGIKAFQVLIFAEKTDAGSGSICPVIRNAGTDYDGTSVALTTSFTYVRQPYDANPGTGARPTETEFNAFEVGYKRTA